MVVPTVVSPVPDRVTFLSPATSANDISIDELAAVLSRMKSKSVLSVAKVALLIKCVPLGGGM